MPIQTRDRGVVGSLFPCSLLQGWLTHVTTNRVGSTVLPKRGIGPAFPSAVADEGPGIAALMTSNSKWERDGISPLLKPPYGR